MESFWGLEITSFCVEFAELRLAASVVAEMPDARAAIEIQVRIAIGLPIICPLLNVEFLPIHIGALRISVGV